MQNAPSETWHAAPERSVPVLAQKGCAMPDVPSQNLPRVTCCAGAALKWHKSENNRNTMKQHKTRTLTFPDWELASSHEILQTVD